MQSHVAGRDARPDPTVLVLVDVGTGSGAIAVTLALERPGIRAVGIERSSTALSFARRNASLHGCRVEWIQGDLVEGVAPRSADLIVANLPYLDPTAAAQWPAELAWEPWMALDGGRLGMERIEALIHQASRVLRPGGILVLEIGMEQGEAVRRAAHGSPLRLEAIRPDLARLDRVAVLRL